MANMNYRQIKAREKACKERWLRINPTLTDESGIYILARVDEEGIKYGYVGQAKHILTRLAQHLIGYQHIDLSLKKHGLWSEKNPMGWRVREIERCDEADLDDMERRYIRRYAELGYQLRNKTAGGQDAGKVGINDNKPSRGYYDGKKQGYEDARRFVAQLFEKNLRVEIQGKDGALKQRALAKFLEFIGGNDEDTTE